MDQPTDTIMHEFHPSSMCTRVYMCVGVCVYCCEWERICVSDTEGEHGSVTNNAQYPLVTWSISPPEREPMTCIQQPYSWSSLQTDVHTCCADTFPHILQLTTTVSVFTLPTAVSWYFISHKFHLQSQLCWCIFQTANMWKDLTFKALMFVCKQGRGRGDFHTLQFWLKTFQAEKEAVHWEAQWFPSQKGPYKITKVTFLVTPNMHIMMFWCLPLPHLWRFLRHIQSAAHKLYHSCTVAEGGLESSTSPLPLED